MSLELINTVAALTTAVVITATAVAALAQLRHLRAGNQIAGFLTLRNMLDDDAHLRAMALIRAEKDTILADESFRRFVLAGRTGNASEMEAARNLADACNLISNAFEVMGTLVRNGIVDRRIFFEQYCGSIATSWRFIEPYIAAARESQRDDGLFEDFEYLAVLSQQFMIEHSSVYPKGLKRLLPSVGSTGRTREV